MNPILTTVLSNTIIATAIAIFATFYGRVGRNAAAAHLLWIAVLVKMFTPALITFELPITKAWRTFDVYRNPTEAIGGDYSGSLPGWNLDHNSVSSKTIMQSRRPQQSVKTGLPFEARHNFSWQTAFGSIWLLGSIYFAMANTNRIRRFKAATRDNESAPVEIQVMVRKIGATLELKSLPSIRMTTAWLPPSVWFDGIGAQLIFPKKLFCRLGSTARQAIVAHELTHVRRGDHLVRWFELFATTLLWWHPLVWLARRKIRECEEECCDSRVLELIPDSSRIYATALVDTLDFLSERQRHALPLVTTIHSFGSIERRIHMLSRPRKNRLNRPIMTLIGVLTALPLVTSFADESSPAAIAEEGGIARLRGTVRSVSGATLEGVRVRIAIPATDMRFVNASTQHRTLEATTNANGDFFFKVKTNKSIKVSFDTMHPGYRRLVGTLMKGGDARSVEIVPKKVVSVDLEIKPSSYFTGRVVDESGKPIPHVHVAAIAAFPRSSGGVEQTATDVDGRFEIFNFPKDPLEMANQEARGWVTFRHPDYLASEIKDVYELLDEERRTLQITLNAGSRVSGTLLNAAGQPAEKQLVRVSSPDGSGRKDTTTDKTGSFKLQGLPDGPLKLTALNVVSNEKVEQAIDSDGPTENLEIQMNAIELPNLKSYSVLGMKLAYVNQDVKEAYNLYFDRGALILDPGENSERFQIGKLEPGNNIWMVGQRRIASVREFVEELIAEAEVQKLRTIHVRVVYHFKNGSNTQYMLLTKADLESLRRVFPSKSKGE